MSEPTSLLLVRHGESEWNAAGRWQGQADPPLTALGRAQAKAAATSIAALHANTAFVEVRASDLDRAHTTASVIAAHLGLPDPIVETGLRERFAGPWQGLTRDEIEAQWPGAIAARRWPDGYESDESIVARLFPVLARLAEEQPGEAIVAVAHGGLIRALDRSVGADEVPVPNLGGRWYRLIVAGTELAVDPGEAVELAGPQSVQNVE